MSYCLEKKRLKTPAEDKRREAETRNPYCSSLLFSYPRRDTVKTSSPRKGEASVYNKSRLPSQHHHLCTDGSISTSAASICEQISVRVCISLNFEAMCVHAVEGGRGRRERTKDFMMNMEALFSHAYLHREPSAPCQCITCSSEPSPRQQGEGGLGEVMALMGGAVAGDKRGGALEEEEEEEEEEVNGREVAGRMSSSAGGEIVQQESRIHTCLLYSQQPASGAVSSHRSHLLDILLKDFRTQEFEPT